MKRPSKTFLVCTVSLFVTGALSMPTAAQDHSVYSEDAPFSLSLRSAPGLSLSDGRPGRLQDDGGGSAEDEGVVLSGPYFLRSADPEAPGELELKFIYGFETSSSEDEHEVEFVLEWGMMEDIEFILEIPVTLGEGRVEGNGDIAEFGFHIRHWRETDVLPAFATRHLLRLPTGYHSDGIDYLLRGLLTKTLISDALRLHFNPFIRSVNGNMDHDTRHLQWGAAIGVDYQVSEDLLLIGDYQNFGSAQKGESSQQSLEFGADWGLAPHRKLAFQTQFEIDGDSHGTDFGVRISYIIELDAPTLR